ncbi:MAG: hypothetical protein V4591_05435 [Bdellovibrionota bacterium]
MLTSVNGLASAARSAVFGATEKKIPKNIQTIQQQIDGFVKDLQKITDKHPTKGEKQHRDIAETFKGLDDAITRLAIATGEEQSEFKCKLLEKNGLTSEYQTYSLNSILDSDCGKKLQKASEGKFALELLDSCVRCAKNPTQVTLILSSLAAAAAGVAVSISQTVYIGSPNDLYNWCKTALYTCNQHYGVVEGSEGFDPSINVHTMVNFIPLQGGEDQAKQIAQYTTSLDTALRNAVQSISGTCTPSSLFEQTYSIPNSFINVDIKIMNAEVSELAKTLLATAISTLEPLFPATATPTPTATPNPSHSGGESDGWLHDLEYQATHPTSQMYLTLYTAAAVAILGTTLYKAPDWRILPNMRRFTGQETRFNKCRDRIKEINKEINNLTTKRPHSPSGGSTVTPTTNSSTTVATTSVTTALLPSDNGKIAKLKEEMNKLLQEAQQHLTRMKEISESDSSFTTGNSAKHKERAQTCANDLGTDNNNGLCKIVYLQTGFGLQST